MARAELKNPSILEAALNDPKFSILCKACQTAGIAETLREGGPYTLFAPTNEAFQQLPKGVLDDLLKPQNRERLITLLTYHVIPGKLSSTDLKMGKIRTLSGKKCELSRKGEKLCIDQALIINLDIPCSNGCIHCIDQVLLPQSSEPFEKSR